MDLIPEVTSHPEVFLASMSTVLAFAAIVGLVRGPQANIPADASQVSGIETEWKSGGTSALDEERNLNQATGLQPNRY